MLNKHFESEENNLISKKDLGIAVRKFISRFLLGERFTKIEWNIFLFLREKSELWNEKINSKENENQFNKEMDKLDSFNIQIKQSIDFYEKLGGERAEQIKNEENDNVKNKKKKKEKEKKI